jgi:hypothetical protein
MSGYYPDGVTSAHPYFNPPVERATGVECGADEALVVPSFAVKGALYQILEVAKSGNKAGTERLVAELLAVIPDWEQEREYECPFHDEIDLEESECAQWVCPVCGNDRETDTVPEDVDPDRAYEEMRDARYDD